MRIGIASKSPSHPGGMERYAMDLAEGLAKRDINTIFFTPRFRNLPLKNERIERHEVKTLSLFPRAWKNAALSRKVRKAKTKAGIDVLIGCTRVDSADIAICGGTHRGFLHAMQKTMRYKDKKAIQLESRGYEKASIIMAHSALMREELINLYAIPENKIQLLYPPINHFRFTTINTNERKEVRRKYGFKDDEIVLLFPSSGHARKGLDLVAAAVKKLGKPIVLAIAGKPSTYTSDNIRYLGYVHNIETCYQAADFTILAPLYEPFGLVGVESVLCGTPVIFPNNVGCNEVLNDRARFSFESSNLDSLCAALEKLVQKKHGNLAACRLSQPENHILYDYRLTTHLDAVTKMAKKVYVA